MENQTTFRSRLATIVGVFIVMMVISFLYILIRGMAWVPDQQKNSIDLTEGETQLISYQGNRVWMTRISHLQKQQLTTLSSLVYQDTGCDVSQEICFVQSKTDRQGILLLYLTEKPDVLSKNQQWFGGFLNPATNAVYDLLGRGYLSNPANSPKTVFFKHDK